MLYGMWIKICLNQKNWRTIIVIVSIYTYGVDTAYCKKPLPQNHNTVFLVSNSQLPSIP
mgnify:CR=1 FL=1